MKELNVIIEQKDGVIDFSNFEQLKEQLSGYLEEYRSAVFTEESKTFAKTVVAELRRLKKAVNDRKIDVKKAYMKPYDEFESKTKELLALIEDPITLIDSQVQEFEKKRVKERKQQIRDIYEEMIGDMAEFAPLDRMYSGKWENASTSAKKIREEMNQAMAGIRMDIESLRLMRVESHIVTYALDQYKKGMTAVEAMRRANEFAELEEKRKQAEEENKRKLVEELKRPEPIYPPEPTLEMGFPDTSFVAVPESESSLPFITPSTKRVAYQIVASDNEIEDLETYMNSVGICFERMN